MRWIKDVRWRLRALFDRRAMDRELNEEMTFHLDMEARKNLRAGVDPREARRRAHVKFGGVDRHKERAQASWGVGFIDDMLRDFRHALRQLMRNPAFTLLATLTLALGIGGTVALFSVVDGLMLRPLPYEDEAELLTFWSPQDWRGVEYDYLRERVRAFESLETFGQDRTAMQSGEGTTLVNLVQVSAGLLDMLGTPPLMGRTFVDGEDRPGTEPVVVLSQGLWEQELGSDPNVLGKRLVLGGVPTTIIGVMPSTFYFPTPESRMWRPLNLDPADGGYHGNGWLELVGRLRPGATPGEVDAELTLITTALGERFNYPEAWDKTTSAYFTPMREYLMGDVRPALLLLLGAVGLLLLMACANVAALILARTSDRVGELAVRTALGAGRGRLARQILTESVTLGLGAGAVGMVLAAILFDVMVSMLPLSNGFQDTLSLDWTTLAAALALSVTVGSLISVIPIRGMMRGRLEGELVGERSQGGGVTAGGGAHGALVLAEVLLAVMLVTGASLLVRSVSHLQSLNIGMDPAGVLAIDLQGEAAMEGDELKAFLDDLVEAAAILPGVNVAGITNRLPIRDGGYQGPIAIEDRPDLEGASRPNSMWRSASLDYFETMGIPVVQGRTFDEQDRPESLPVVIVSESFAARMWPGESPLGRRISTGFEGSSEWLTVVGVAGEVRMTSLVGNNTMVMFRPSGQGRGFGLSNVLVLKTDLDPAALTGPVRALVRRLNPRVATARASLMEDVVAASMAEPLRLRLFLGLFAALGLLLGTVGVYGVVSYSVVRRRAEFGIRMALGAEPRELVGAVVRGGMVPVLGGIAGGIVASAVLSNVLASFLFGVEPMDMVSFGAAGGALLAAGMVAAALPGIRAGRTDPAEALRAE